LLNERQERILLSLKKLDFLSREQLQRIHNLGKVRNANRILRTLSPYLQSFRENYSTVYYLSKEGREYVNTDKVRRKNQFVNHVLMRNEVYILMKCPHEWKNEMKVHDGQYTVICDAWFKAKGKYHFVEIDSTQKMKENREKIKQYQGLYQNGALTNHLGYFPLLIWVTTTEFRRKQLKELCPFPCEVYTLDDIR
jgi:hypothetical protein